MYLVSKFYTVFFMIDAVIDQDQLPIKYIYCKFTKYKYIYQTIRNNAKVQLLGHATIYEGIIVVKPFANALGDRQRFGENISCSQSSRATKRQN